jgi:WD40 repeat protein
LTRIKKLKEKLKMKKLFILLVVVLIFIAAVIFTAIAAVLPWFVTRGDQSATAVDTSGPAQTANSILPPMPTMTTMPAYPTSSPTPVFEQLSPAPICFTPAYIHPFAFMPDSTSILVRGNTGVQIFNLDALKEASFLRAPKNIITAALSPDGKILAWSLDDNTIQLLRISDQKVLQTLSGHNDMVGKLRFSPDGDQLVSASHDYWVRVWNMQGEELRHLQAGQVLGIGISPDGNMLATVPFDGPVALWNLDTGENIKDLGGYGGYDTSDAEFSPDGQYLAADLASGIFMWRVADASLVWDKVKNSMVVAFSPDGRYLAYSDVDDGNKVILVSPYATRVIRIIEGMQSPVWELFFSPDSFKLAATDGIAIHIWRVEDGTLLYTGKASCP